MLLYITIELKVRNLVTPCPFLTQICSFSVIDAFAKLLLSNKLGPGECVFYLKVLESVDVFLGGKKCPDS
jgi:hypothetical protein